MADLLLSPPKPISKSAVQAAIKAARKRVKEQEEGYIPQTPGLQGENEEGTFSDGAKKKDEQGNELIKLGDEWLDVVEYTRKKRLLDEAEERKRKRMEPDEEAKRAGERFREAKKQGDDIVLGFSIKDEKILENRDMLRRRMFPVGFKQWAKNVQEVNVTATRAFPQLELALFLVFAMCGIGYLATVISSTTVFTQYNSIKIAIMHAYYFPFRTQHLKRSEGVEFLENWETFDTCQTIDELQSWMYQVLTSRIIPSVNRFNTVVRGIRVTQRRVKLIDQDPEPLLGSYDRRWATTHLTPDSSFSPTVEDTTSSDKLILSYTRGGGYKKKGGYVFWLDGSDPDKARETLSRLANTDYYSRQTAAITMEFLLANSYLPSLTKVLIRLKIHPSSVMDKNVMINSVDSSMLSLNASILVAATSLILSTIAILYHPFIAIRRRGFTKWVKTVGLWDVFTLSGCCIGVLIGVGLEISSVAIFGPPLNIQNSDSDISKWLGDGSSRIDNGQMSGSDNEAFNGLVSHYDAYISIYIAKLFFYGLAVFSAAMRLVKYFSYVVSYRATVIIWVARQFVIPALTIFFVMLCITIGFSVAVYYDYGGSNYIYSQFRLAFLHTAAALLGDWPNNASALHKLNRTSFIEINIFFVTCYYALTYLMLALLIQGYETAAEDMDIQLEPLKRKERLYRYHWFKVRVSMKEFGINTWDWFLTVLRVRKPIYEDEGTTLDETSEEYNMHNIDQNTMKSVEMTYYDGDRNAAFPSANLNQTLQDELHGGGTGYEYTDENGNVMQYDPYYFMYGADQVTQQAGSGGDMGFRWDWYDPYKPPDDYQPPVANDQKSADVSNLGGEQMGDLDPVTQQMKQVDEEYFSDMGFTMSGTHVRPDLKNIQTYSRSQKLKHTPFQLISMIFLAIVAIVLVFQTFVNPGENFVLEQAFDKTISAPTWVENRSIAENVWLQTPRFNWRAIISRTTFFRWFSNAMPALLYPPSHKQKDTVFNKHTFPDEKYPPLAAYWASGLGLQGARLAVFQLSERRQTSIDGPYERNDPRLIQLGFTGNDNEGSHYLFFPSDEEEGTELIQKLVTEQFIDDNTAIVEFSIVMLNVNAKRCGNTILRFRFTTEGEVNKRLYVDEIHPNFVLGASSGQDLGYFILFICAVVASTLSEVHAFMRLYLQEKALRHRIVGQRETMAAQGLLATSMNVSQDDVQPLTIPEAFMIYFFEKSFLDHITGFLSMVLLGAYTYIYISPKDVYMTPLNLEQLESLHDIMPASYSVSWIFKISLSWLLPFSFLRLTALLRDDKRFGIIRLSIVAFLWDFIFAASVILALLIGFGFMFFISFGTTIEEFRTYRAALLSTFYMIVGQFNFSILFTSYPVMSLLFIFPFWALLYVTSLNIFTAIFVRSFSARVAEVEEAERLGLCSSESFVSQVNRCFLWLLRKCKNQQPQKPEPDEEEIRQWKDDDEEEEDRREERRERRGRTAPADDLLSEEILALTKVTQMSDTAFDSLPLEMRLFAEAVVLEIIDRFRKLELGISLYGPTGDKEWGQRFIAELEDKLFTELMSDIRDSRLLEGKLRHRLNIYEHIAKEGQDDLSRFILNLENTIEEVEADIREHQELYDARLAEQEGKGGGYRYY